MTILFENNSSSLLAADITTTGQTTLVVTTGEGVLFPAPTGGDYFVAAIEDNLGNIEFVQVTDRTGDTFTIVRGFDGSTAQTWTAGARVELRNTAIQMEEFIQRNGDAMTGTLESPTCTQPLELANKTYVDTGDIMVGGIENNIVSVDNSERIKDSGLSIANISQAELDILDGLTRTTADLNDAATLTGIETLTNKTHTDPVLNGVMSGSGVDNDSALAANSSTLLATQQAIKAYVDAVTAQVDALKQMTVLDSPIELVNTTYGTNQGWSSLTHGSIPSTASAVLVEAELRTIYTASNGASANLFFRKTGTIPTSPFVLTQETGDNLGQVYNTAQFWVGVNGSQQFDWQLTIIVFPLVQANVKIKLAGWYA